MPTTSDLHPSQRQPPEALTQFQLRSGEHPDAALVPAMKEERHEETDDGGQQRLGEDRREVAYNDRPVAQPGQESTEELKDLALVDRERRLQLTSRRLMGPADSAQVARQASAGTPTWLTDAVLRMQQARQASEAAAAARAATVEANILNNQKKCSCPADTQSCVCGALPSKTHNSAGAEVLGSTSSQPQTGQGYCNSAHWLSMPAVQSQGALDPTSQRRDHDNVKNGNNQYDPSAEDPYGLASRQGQETEVIEHADAENSSEHNDGDDPEVNWLLAKRKADIVSHPLFPELLSAHVACLRIATPVDQLPTIDAQLAQSHLVISKYQALNIESVEENSDKEELEQYMADGVMVLRSFKDQLQQHVRIHAMDAVMGCFEIEKQLEELTGIRLGDSGQGSGALMSDDEDDILVDDAAYAYDPSLLDGNEIGGFGPLVPSETERTLMERVRQELKSELKQGYRAKIIDVREEILRKRRAGKLPGDTTTVLKTWWHAHAKWPYPTEDEKARLVQETGLELKQINNWFINQRKRNWHANPSAASAKTKRKR